MDHIFEGENKGQQKTNVFLNNVIVGIQYLLGKQILKSWQRLICEVGKTTVINTTVINNRN